MAKVADLSPHGVNYDKFCLDTFLSAFIWKKSDDGAAVLAQTVADLRRCHPVADAVDGVGQFATR